MMAQSIVVSVAFLRHAAEVLLNHVEEVAGAEVSLEADYFWAIPAPSRYDVTSEPTSLTIGQLTESLEFLQHAADNPDARVARSLVWLADLLRAVGEEVPK
jgi:hypothetical protein